MKYFFVFMIFLLSFSLHADHFRTKIHSIDVSKKPDSPHLILLENGRVLFIESQEKGLLENFRDSLKHQDLLEIEVDDQNNFIRAETLKGEAQAPAELAKKQVLSKMYNPSVVSSGQATAIFRRMRRDYQNDSQCYNRAHIWAYEEYLHSGLQSEKLFLFFTRRYIRNYRYKWWFHVSPMTYVGSTNSGSERVLDRRYTSGTRTIYNWTRNFIYSGRTCPVVHRYYDYRNNQETQDCYLIPVSMYFWQPRDIERRDRTGYEKQQFYTSEVNYAYWEAF